MGSPVEGSWDAVANAPYYVGVGGWELPWLLISIALCVLALVIGHRHESAANKD